MALDEDTLETITGKKIRRGVGIGPIVHGRMELLSSKATYTAPYPENELYPGPMMLSILTAHNKHRLDVDLNSEVVLMYGDGNTARLVASEQRLKKVPLRAQRYTLAKAWYTLSVSRAEKYLVK